MLGVSSSLSGNTLYPVTQKFALQNFLNFFESYISSYRNPSFSNWNSVKSALETKMDDEKNEDGIPLPFLRK